MPRIRQKAEEYAVNDFLGEINAQRARYGLNSFEALGNAIGVTAKTAWSYMRDLDNIRFETLRLMVRVLKPNPELLLKALGYSGKEIREMARIIVSR